MSFKIKNTIFEALRRRFQVEEPRRLELLNDNIQIVQSLDNLNVFQGTLSTTVGNINNLFPLIKLFDNNLEPGNELGFLVDDFLKFELGWVSIRIQNLASNPVAEAPQILLRYTYRVSSNTTINDNFLVFTFPTTDPGTSRNEIHLPNRREFFSKTRIDFEGTPNRGVENLHVLVDQQTNPVDIVYRLAIEVKVTLDPLIERKPFKSIREFKGVLK